VGGEIWGEGLVGEVFLGCIVFLLYYLFAFRFIGALGCLLAMYVCGEDVY
jgi:hypothetical protein